MAGQRLTQKKNFLSFPFPPSIKRFKSSLPGEASDRPRVSTIDPAFLPSQFSHLWSCTFPKLCLRTPRFSTLVKILFKTESQAAVLTQWLLSWGNWQTWSMISNLLALFSSQSAFC
jgi:hypothetical protein